MSVRLSDLIPQPEPQRTITGFQFTEGPVWHPDGYLLFSDIFASTIYRWTPDGSAEPYIKPSQESNGLTFDRQGRLVACQHAARQVGRMNAGGQLETVADRYEGKRLNSPNDLVVHSDGSIYFTDPPFAVSPDLVELDFIGVFRIAPDGSMTVLTSDFLRPNGLAFSPNESLLYIADSYRRHVRAFDVGPDGTLSNSHIFIDMNVETPRNPDGIKVDVDGNVYIAGADGLWVVDPNGGHLGTIPYPEQPGPDDPFPNAGGNLAFGGPNNQTIYIAFRTSIYTIHCNVPGVRVY